MRIVYCILLAFLAQSVHAQSFTFDYDPGSNYSGGAVFDAIETPGHDIVMVGGYALPNTADIFFLQRMDTLGNLIWQTDFSMPNAVEYFYPTQVIYDRVNGGFIVSGREESNTVIMNTTWLTYFDSTGTVVWMNAYETSIVNGGLGRLNQLTDGRFVAPIVDSFPAIMYFNSAGQVLNRVRYNTSQPLGELIPDNNNGHYFVGSSVNGIMLRHCDSAGTIFYERHYNFAMGWEFDCYDVAPMGDSAFILAGQYHTTTSSWAGYPSLIKMDTAGYILWRTALQDSSTTNYGSRVERVAITTSGKIYTAGVYWQTNALRVFSRFNSNGSLDTSLWLTSPGGVSRNIMYSLHPRSGDRIIISTHLESPGGYPGNLLLPAANDLPCGTPFPFTEIIVPYEIAMVNPPVPTTDTFAITVTPGSFVLGTPAYRQVGIGCFEGGFLGVPDATPVMDVKAYPNPMSDITTIALNGTPTAVTITDATGKVVYQTVTNERVIYVDCSGFATGLYIITCESESSVFRDKLIRE